MHVPPCGVRKEREGTEMEIDGGSWAPQKPGGRGWTKHRKSRGSKTRKEVVEEAERPLTCLQWRSDKPIDSALLREIPIMLKALVSTATT